MTHPLASHCPSCGGSEVATEAVRRNVSYLGYDRVSRSTEVAAEACRCAACGFRWSTPEQRSSLTEPVAVAMGAVAPSAVRAARLRRSWSQQDLARESGIGRHRIGQIERCQVIATAEEDSAIRRALHLGLRVPVTTSG